MAESPKRPTRRPAKRGDALIWPADELPFIREIHALPFEDAPRLVFADWLEERGDPRAEFIRVQIGLSTLPARDPAYPALQAREMELLYRHRKGWLRFPKTPGIHWEIKDGDFRPHPGYGGFTRGLPAAVTVSTLANFVRKAGLLVDEFGMHELRFEIRSREEAETMARLPQLSKLDVLYLTASMPQLLQSPRLGPLSRLQLGRSHPELNVLREFLAGPQSSRLRWVSTDDRDPAELLAVIAQSQRARQIDTLILGDAETNEWTSALEDCPQWRLSRLKCGSYPNGSKLLSNCPALSELVTLHLAGVLATEELANLCLPPKVVNLALVPPGLQDPATPLARSAALQQLHTLDLSDHQITDAGALALAQANLEQLHTLRLNHNLLTPMGVQALIDSDRLPRLQRLEIAGNNLSSHAHRNLMAELHRRRASLG